MKTIKSIRRNLIICILSFCCIVHSLAQVQPLPGVAPTTNINQNGYPRILDDLRVVFQVRAVDAKTVQIDLGKLYNLTRNEQGVWSVTTDPQVPGFHYYSLVIDGVKVADPASASFYGTRRMSSAIEIPEKGADFYQMKDVRHGTVSSRIYYSTVTGGWRRLFVYTPADYDANPNLRLPVVYIQHGGGEDERGWVEQGHTNLILDNLIAAGKAKPMIVVVSNGNVSVGAGGYSTQAMAAFGKEMTENIVPFVDKTYRTLPNATNRALCGLSMGGGQSFYIGLANLNVFSSIGVFSSGIFGGISSPTGVTFDAEKEMPGLLSQSSVFNARLKLFYISVGEKDPRLSFTGKAVSLFREKGLKVEFASFPGDHEWQVWRKSLNDFASRVFK
jgi:enterochelin esterase-like enzyme